MFWAANSGNINTDSVRAIVNHPRFNYKTKYSGRGTAGDVIMREYTHGEAGKILMEHIEKGRLDKRRIPFIQARYLVLKSNFR